MPMTHEALDMIELDAAIAPVPMLDHYVRVVHDSMPHSPREVQEHALALLLKLEQLVQNQRVPHVNDRQEYLAPQLMLVEPQPLAA